MDTKNDEWNQLESFNDSSTFSNNLNELEKELKSNIIEGVYLMYGEETFLLESSLKKMKKLFGELILRYKLYSNR